MAKLRYEIVNQSLKGKYSLYRVYTYSPTGEELNIHDFDTREQAEDFVRQEKEI